MKSSDYKIKCIHKDNNTISISPNTNLESETLGEEEAIKSLISFTKESKNGITPSKKLAKFSKNEIVFKLQIYSV